MKSLKFQTNSAEETIELGRLLAGVLPLKGVVLLIGNLGAGKTTLAKGIAKGRAAAEPEEVSSPTYTLIHEYGKSLYHVDLYRLEDARQAGNLGLGEIFERDALVLIEWGDRFPEILPGRRIEIRLAANGDNGRTIEISGGEPARNIPERNAP